eukprot:SAG11_NODE_29626_length_309_cov_0.685714_1_plen_55_part_01
MVLSLAPFQNLEYWKNQLLPILKNIDKIKGILGIFAKFYSHFFFIAFFSHFFFIL